MARHVPSFIESMTEAESSQHVEALLQVDSSETMLKCAFFAYLIFDIFFALMLMI
jgi:hypothetical protein